VIVGEDVGSFRTRPLEGTRWIESRGKGAAD